jgi:hypothetical protein
MKLYRVQARYKNIYIDKMLEAENDKAALETFSNGVSSGEITGTDEGFYGTDRVYITFEEVNRDATTKVNLGETSVGVQVGNQSVRTGESNS